jgi:hypothetical protein
VALGPGLTAPWPHRWRRFVLGGVVGVLAIISLVAPIRYIAPAYRRPQPVSDESAISERIGLRYGDWGELVGYDMGERVLDRDDELELTLYWRGLRPVDVDYDMYIHLRAPDGSSMGQLDSYPGAGMYQTSLWTDEVVADRYRVPVDVVGSEAMVGRVEVGFGLPGEPPVAATDPQGRSVTPILAEFKLRGTGDSREADAQHGHMADDPRFGELAALVSWSLDGRQDQLIRAKAGETLTLGLEWVAVGETPDDLRVFVHVAGEDLRPLAQADGEPRGGSYSTSWWEPGERIEDPRDLALPVDMPPGSYRVLVGLYRPTDGVRLPVSVAGQPVGDVHRLPVELVIEPPGS